MMRMILAAVTLAAAAAPAGAQGFSGSGAAGVAGAQGVTASPGLHALGGAGVGPAALAIDRRAAPVRRARPIDTLFAPRRGEPGADAR